jgi:hypothetical protein
MPNDNAYIKIYSYKENGDLADVKIILIKKDGEITMENAIGNQKKESPSKEKTY